VSGTQIVQGCTACPLLPDPIVTVVALGLGGPVQKIWRALSYVEHSKIFRHLPCENVVTATCFVHISILTGTSVSNYPG